jgi:hypothetical protein
VFGRRASSPGTWVVVAVITVIATVVLAQAASAASVHPFASSFGGGVVGAPMSVAVDETTGDTYVLDVSNGTVAKFDASGSPASFSALGTSTLDGAGNGDCAGTPADCDQTPQNGFAFDGSVSGAQVAVDNSSGPAAHDIYVTNSFNGVVDVFDQTGTYVGELDGSLATPQSGGEVTGVAVAPSGDVYVSSNAGHVDRYTVASADPAGDTFVSQLENLPTPGNVAVDSTGAVYVSQYGGFGPATKYDAGQLGLDTPSGSTIDGSSTAVAVDPSSDDVYVDEGGQVAQYDATGAKTGRSGFGTLSGASFGVAIHGSTGELLASDAGSNPPQVDRFGAAVSVNAPTVSDVTVSNVTSSGADFSGTVNPQGTDPSSDTSWHFEYSTDGGGSWTNTPSPDADAGTGTADVPVNASVSFLPNQPVQVRLVASNQAATVTSAVASFTTTALAPDVTTEPAQDVALAHASLQGLLNPHNAATTYHFEYGPTTGYGHSIPAPEGDAGSGNLLEAVIQPLYGLASGTTYHYRLVASSVGGTTDGADQTFTTTTSAQPGSCSNNQFRHGHAAALPDCRAWELVSPPDKRGGEVMPVMQRVRAASGESPSLPMAVSFASLTGFGDVQGISISTEYLAQRTLRPSTSGWATHSITPAQGPGDFISVVRGSDQDPAYVGDFSADLTHGAFRSWSPLTDAPNVAAVPNLYTRSDLRSAGAGTWTLLSDAASPVPHNIAKPFFAGASTDFSHVIFESFQSLTPEVPPCTPGPAGVGCSPHLYEAVNGVTRLVGILPDDACGSPPCVAAGSVAGQGASVNNHYTPHTISADGRRIVFTDTSTGHLYLRTDGTSTVQLDASENQNDPHPDPASYSSTYWDASADCSRAFFTSSARLTSDAPNNGATHVYMYSVGPDGSGHHLTRLDIDSEPHDGGDADGVVGVSGDAHYVYFISGGQLVNGKPLLRADRGLYVWHDESGIPRLDYIGRFANPSDVTLNLLTNWQAQPSVAEVTPDGRHLLFGATDGRGLTGYDQTSACDDAKFDLDRINGCTQLYVYSAGQGDQPGTLQCATCDPSGAPATSDAVAIIRKEGTVSLPTSHAAHALSDDGRFVFFHTSDALVPEDVNGKVDAYEYDTTDGSVHLLSSGADPSDSYFLDASANGRDVFIATRERLVGWDHDVLRDLYDVRVDGGVPDPPPAPLPCNGDACQGAQSTAPAGPGIANATPGSLGNASVPTARHRHRRLVCRHGFVKKRVRHRVRCVRRRHRARHARRASARAGLSVHADRKGR